MSTLQARNYVATSKDIVEIVKARIAHAIGVVSADSDYLKALVATTVNELGVTPRLRAGKQDGLLDEDTIKVHAAAFETVHGRFYADVLKAVNESGGTAKERNAKSNFARSAASTLRRWIKAGNDIRLLAPARVTKGALAVQTAAREQSPDDRVLRMVDNLVDFASELDKRKAAALLRSAMDRLSTALLEFVPKTTTATKTALAEHQFFSPKSGGLFWPVTQEAGSDASPQ